jgi:TonB-dependent Receptor Plug Domain
MLRIPAPTVWRRLLGATMVSIACLASSGFAWVSNSQVQSSASFSKVVSEGDFVINLKADLRSASKKEAVKTNMFDTVRAGKVAKFRVYLDGKTYCIAVIAEADTDNNRVVFLTVAYGMIAADGEEVLQEEPTIATVENHDAYIQIGDSVKNEISGMIDLVVTRNTQFTHPMESRTMTSSRAKSMLTSVTAAGLLAGASAPSQAQVADTAYTTTARSGRWTLIKMNGTDYFSLLDGTLDHYYSAWNFTHLPIVIVDGVRLYYTQSDISQIGKIDPKSIHTVEWVEGQEALAKYGPDAVNGVWVIRSYTYDGIKKP